MAGKRLVQDKDKKGEAKTNNNPLKVGKMKFIEQIILISIITKVRIITECWTYITKTS